jgi:DNA replication and repair protein RecF
VWLAELQLADFRNYRQLQLDLTRGTHLFFGENGEGKTNLVEAVGFLGNLESHRIGQQKSLVRQGADTATLSAKVQHSGRQVLIAAELNRNSVNRYFLNTKAQKRASDLIGFLSAVIFAPEDLDLVRRDPADRRHFLDYSMAQLRPRLAGLKQDYDRVLKQRNALLKSARSVKSVDLTTLDIWDDQLIDLGSKITEARLELIAQIEPLLQSFYKSLSASQDQVSLTLVSLNQEESEENINRETIADQLRSRLEVSRERELERGITLVGPHRDELIIEKAGMLARSHASQGEAWSLALGLKLAMAQLIREGAGGDPVLILDDVFAVLDPGRRKRLIEFVQDFEQVLVTAADRDGTPEIAWAAAHEVSGGELK